MYRNGEIHHVPQSKVSLCVCKGVPSDHPHKLPVVSDGDDARNIKGEGISDGEIGPDSRPHGPLENMEATGRCRAHGEHASGGSDTQTTPWSVDLALEPRATGRTDHEKRCIVQLFDQGEGARALDDFRFDVRVVGRQFIDAFSHPVLAKLGWAHRHSNDGNTR